VVEVVHPVGDAGAFICSGTVVAPNLVLTARHCVTGTTGESFTCDDSGNGSDGGTLGADYDPATVFVYAGLEAPGPLTTPSAHGLRFFHDTATNVCNHDLALIELSQTLSTPLAPLDLDTKLSAGGTITAIGWGVVADGGSPSVRQQLGAVPIVTVGPSDDDMGYEVPPSEFAVGVSICEGDSGGPALDTRGAVVGVVSSGGNDVTTMSSNAAATCVGPTTVNLYTETAAFRDVILGAFTAVGAIPVLVAVPMGEPCSSAGECTSGLCAVVEPSAGRVCTESCKASACPGGFRCDTTGGEALCTPSPSSGCSASSGPPPWGAVLASGMVALWGVRARRRRARATS
jgi:MYXO-CTERM domain-containing protein